MSLSLHSTLHEQVTPEFLTVIDTAITTIEHAAEFLISLDSDDRRRLRAFGPSNEAFVPDVIEAATRHDDLVPARRGAAEIAARRDATVALVQRVTRLEELRQRFSDTGRVTGDACVALSMDTYQFLKRLAESEGIEATVDRLGRRFAANVAAARKPRPSRPGTTTTTSGGAASPAPSSGSAPTAAAPNVVPLPAGASPLAQAA